MKLIDKVIIAEFTFGSILLFLNFFILDFRLFILVIINYTMVNLLILIDMIETQNETNR